MSDLHIATTDAGTQFDRDAKIREAILDDLGKEERDSFDAILVTGDIAFSGRAEEFLRAKSWLEDLRARSKSNPEALFVVPGNHDVNRGTVSRSSSLWDLHQMLRSPNKTPEERLGNLRAKLQDKSLDFLAALKEYRAFAQEYGCPTSRDELAWVQYLDNDDSLEDGTPVRFHGLNSALLSDADDAKANLLLGEFQFTHFDADPRYVNVVLCHHPQSWLMDGNEANDFFRHQAHIVLCGHEHITRCYCEGQSLRVFAGAVHPNRLEQAWQPCYHILRLSIANKEQRILRVNIETRIWRDKDKRFARLPKDDGSQFHDEYIPLPEFPMPKVRDNSIHMRNSTLISSTSEMQAPDKNSDALTAARRKLIVHFFRIGVLSRFQAAIEAGVWEDEDDNLDGQARWAKLFGRAEESGKLGALWDAVAAKDPTLAGSPNPFTTKI